MFTRNIVLTVSTQADISSETFNSSGKKLHCKFLKCREDDKDGVDKIRVELATLRAICSQNESSGQNSGVLCYLGFFQFTLDQIVRYTVIVSNFVDGLTFGQWNLLIHPFLKRLQVAKQLVLALSFVHEKGYCHNDLSPNNFIIVEEDHDNISIVLFDFGSAKPPGILENFLLVIIMS